MRSFIKLITALLLSVLLVHGAVAQTGQLQAGQIWGNPAATQKPPTGTTVGAILDQQLSCTARGDIIFRGVALWTCLAPGTSGLPLVSQGAGADLHYAQLGNSALTNTGTTVNGQLCTLGSTCTATAVASSIVTGTTTITGGTTTRVLFNNAGVLGEYAAGQLPATATNDNASAGNIGEYIESVILSASPVSATSNTPSNVTSISLTAGDWDVTGAVLQLPAASTSFTANISSISTTSASLDVTYLVASRFAAFVPVNPLGGHSLTRRISVAGTTTVYLVQQATFTVSTTGGYGYIFARRRR